MGTFLLTGGVHPAYYRPVYRRPARWTAPPRRAHFHRVERRYEPPCDDDRRVRSRRFERRERRNGYVERSRVRYRNGDRVVYERRVRYDH